MTEPIFPKPSSYPWAGDTIERFIHQLRADPSLLEPSSDGLVLFASRLGDDAREATALNTREGEKPFFGNDPFREVLSALHTMSLKGCAGIAKRLWHP